MKNHLATLVGYLLFFFFCMNIDKTIQIRHAKISCWLTFGTDRVSFAVIYILLMN